MTILAPNASEFKAMLATKKPFLADFYATWCGPCKMESYVLDDLDKIMGDKYSQVVMAQQTTRAFQAAGYDGLIYNSSDGHVEHVVFDPKQIYIIGTNVERYNAGRQKLAQRMVVAENLKQQSFEK